MEEKVQRKEIVKITEFPDGINRVHIPILSEEEERKRHQRLYDAGVRLLRAQERCMQQKGE